MDSWCGVGERPFGTRGELGGAQELVEVALPLDAINTGSAREKSIRHGHPNTSHCGGGWRRLEVRRAGAGSPRFRLEPRGRAHQQGDDRDSARARWDAAGEPGHAGAAGRGPRAGQGAGVDGCRGAGTLVMVLARVGTETAAWQSSNRAAASGCNPLRTHAMVTHQVTKRRQSVAWKLGSRSARSPKHLARTRRCGRSMEDAWRRSSATGLPS